MNARGKSTSDIQDNEGRTPLHLAASSGDAEMVRVLISAGADVYAKDADGSTPLHLAVVGGHSETVQILLDAGTSDGETATDNSSNVGQGSSQVGVSQANRGEPLLSLDHNVGASVRQTSGDRAERSMSSGDKLYAWDRRCPECRSWNRWQAQSCSDCRVALPKVLQDAPTREPEKLDIETINKVARTQAEDIANEEKAKNWQQGVHAAVMAPVLISTIIYYDGWFGWLTEVSAWIALGAWYCVSWVCGKIAHGIVRK